MNGLKPAHARFVLEYLRDGNATRAATAAGYSAATAYSQGPRLLSRPDIAQAIEIERARLMAKLSVTPERIVSTLAAIAFGDVRDVVAWDGEGKATITPSDELHEDEAVMVEGVSRRERTDAGGNTTATTDIKLSSRQGALDKLARIQGLYKDRVEIIDGEGLADRLEAKRQARIAARAAAKTEQQASIQQKRSDNA